MKNLVLALTLMLTGCGKNQQSTASTWKAPRFRILHNGIPLTANQANLEDVFSFESDQDFSGTVISTCGDISYEKQFALKELAVWDAVPPDILKKAGSGQSECTFKFVLESNGNKKIYFVRNKRISLELNNISIKISSDIDLLRAQKQDLNIFSAEIKNPYPITVTVGIVTDLGTFNYRMLAFGQNYFDYYFYPETASKPIRLKIINDDYRIYKINSNTLVEIPPQGTLHLSYFSSVDLPNEMLYATSVVIVNYRFAAGLDYSFSKENPPLVYLLKQTQNGVAPSKFLGGEIAGIKNIGLGRLSRFTPFNDGAYIQMNLELSRMTKAVLWNGKVPIPKQ